MSDQNHSRPQGAPVRRSAQQNAARRQPAQPRRGTVQPSNRRPARGGRGGRRTGSFLNQLGNVLLELLKVIWMAISALLSAIGRLFSRFSRLFDVFRKDETSTIIVNSLLGGAVVVVLLCVFLACKPGIDSARARSLASSGNAESATRILRSLENDGYPEEKLNATRLAVARGLIESGRYAEGRAVLSELPESAERTELERQCSYAQASDLYDSGDYSAAAQMFYQMNNYQDSALRYGDCRSALAIEAYQAGDEASARSLLLDVQDADTRIHAVAVKVAGSEEAAQQILSADIFSAENLAHMEQTMENLKAARDDMPEGRIAAGKNHTVGLRSDGTVLAAGDNMYGQCNVSGWRGVKQVAAGANHTVALLQDGTVVATGDNSQHQCDVSGWTDIVAIATAAYDTIGLKADGSVVASGMHSGAVSGWHGVTFITGGSYSMGCLTDSGTMLATHKGAQMEMGAVLYDLSVCGQVSVGILYDGTMVSSFDGAPEWTEMVTATACESGILGIDAYGQVRSHFYREGDGVEISVSGAAVEIASGGTHHVVLTSDGHVYAFGSNIYGQCSVSDWQL